MAAVVYIAYIVLSTVPLSSTLSFLREREGHPLASLRTGTKGFSEDSVEAIAKAFCARWRASFGGWSEVLLLLFPNGGGFGGKNFLGMKIITAEDKSVLEYKFFPSGTVEKKIFASEIKHTKHRSPPPCPHEPLTLCACILYLSQVPLRTSNFLW